MLTTVKDVRALEVLDSRGKPTVCVRIGLEGGVLAEAMVPSGASTGRHEAVELRDGDPRRYGGNGVRRAVANVETILGPAIAGLDASDQKAIDQRLCEADGTLDKSRLGANAILGASCAAARAAASARKIPLWQHLAGSRRATLPVPMVNILSGGYHAAHNIEFQDFLAIAHGFETYHECLEAIVSIHGATYDEIRKRGFVLTGVADEGGWGPLLPSNELALEILTTAIQKAGYRVREQVSIALDVAASHFYEDGIYTLRTEGKRLDSSGMIALLESWCQRYPIVSIEDGLAEDDWDGWRELTARLDPDIQLVGDDLFTTNPTRLDRGLCSGAGNAVLVKMNQIGTLSETFEVIDKARDSGFRAVISARSGETEDSFLADLAVASGMGQIKVGSITRSERLAKYNRLLAIESDEGLEFPGHALFNR